MNLILIGEDDLRDDGRIALGGRRARHIREVLRASPGDELRIGMCRGRLGKGLVVTIGESDPVVLEPRWTGDPAVRPAIDLIIAMPRPKVLARVLQTCACMGVGRIDIVNAWRVNKSYLASPQLSDSSIRANLLLGCEQGATTWVPDVAIHRLLMPFMRGPLVERLASGQPNAIIAHPRTRRSVESALMQDGLNVVLAAIGPERGWVDRELASFRELGFSNVHLGERTLRCEIAVAVLIAQIEIVRRLSRLTDR